MIRIRRWWCIWSGHNSPRLAPLSDTAALVAHKTRPPDTFHKPAELVSSSVNKKDSGSPRRSAPSEPLQRATEQCGQPAAEPRRLHQSAKSGIRPSTPRFRALPQRAHARSSKLCQTGGGMTWSDVTRVRTNETYCNSPVRQLVLRGSWHREAGRSASNFETRQS